MYTATLHLLRIGYLAAWACIGLIGLLAWPVSLLPLALAVCFRARTHLLTVLGSARWATENDLLRAGMLDADHGLILGRLQKPAPRGES